MNPTRRRFLRTTGLATGAVALAPPRLSGSAATRGPNGMRVADLPMGSAPPSLALPHFPSPLHAFIWRNWELVPLDRMAAVVGAKSADLRRLGHRLGLTGPAPVPRDVQQRSAITVIRRNWHLLPYAQLLELLDWTPDQLAFALREDDFLFVKLGNLKPACAPLRYAPSDGAIAERERVVARILRQELPDSQGAPRERLFDFVRTLSTPPRGSPPSRPGPEQLTPRFCYSYFALYGDPLLETAADPYPDGFLARLAATGVDGVWLQAVLYHLVPFPWDPSLSARHEERLDRLRALVRRARRRGIGIWLYLNEPRAMPLAFYRRYPELEGVVEGDYAALCTSVPEVRDYLRDAVSSICRAVPELAGFFTITASENLTNCWSHHGGRGCPRCAGRPPAEVIAEVNAVLREGVRVAGARADFIAWDWGWASAWAEDAIAALPPDVALMSVSEWDMPIARGGVPTTVGEYSISTVGPGPRAQRHWAAARRRGLRSIAKIQAGNTWELAAVPYIPAVRNVAQHAVNLRIAGVDGIMLGWTLGGYPSPNLEVVAAVANRRDPSKPGLVEDAMREVAIRRFGTALAPAVLVAWSAFSAAFSEFPFHGGLVYNAPLQCGPANLLWAESTGYRASMVGFPYDDLDAWRAVYPVDTFIGQLQRVADGLDDALARLRTEAVSARAELTEPQQTAIAEELRVAEAAAIHFRSTANQARFVQTRRRLTEGPEEATRGPLLDELERVLRVELRLAARLYRLQREDARLGFEASNQYFYVPQDLAEKILNCQDLLDRWLPAQRRGVTSGG